MTPAERQQREAAAQAALEEQRLRVGEKMAKVAESKAALLHSPAGLASLFPTNRINIKLKARPRPAQE